MFYGKTRISANIEIIEKNSVVFALRLFVYILQDQNQLKKFYMNCLRLSLVMCGQMRSSGSGGGAYAATGSATDANTKNQMEWSGDPIPTPSISTIL